MTAGNEAFSSVVIDSQLADQGWKTQDPISVRYEYMLPDGTRADYVLCDRYGRSMAVIEAKRFSISPGDAADQAVLSRNPMNEYKEHTMPEVAITVPVMPNCMHIPHGITG